MLILWYKGRIPEIKEINEIYLEVLKEDEITLEMFKNNVDM